MADRSIYNLVLGVLGSLAVLLWGIVTLLAALGIPIPGWLAIFAVVVSGLGLIMLIGKLLARWEVRSRLTSAYKRSLRSAIRDGRELHQRALKEDEDPVILAILASEWEKTTHGILAIFDPARASVFRPSGEMGRRDGYPDIAIALAVRLVKLRKLLEAGPPSG